MPQARPIKVHTDQIDPIYRNTAYAAAKEIKTGTLKEQSDHVKNRMAEAHSHIEWCVTLEGNLSCDW